MVETWKTTEQEGIAKILKLESLEPAYYRLTSPLCLPIVLAHTSAVCSLSAVTHNQLIWWYGLFGTSAIFGPLPLVLARVLFHTVPSHVCIAPTQMRENVTLRLNTHCAFYNLSNTQ